MNGDGDMDGMEERSRAFLKRCGIELESLIAYAPPIDTDECLALMGSIVEGVANDESDIDLLYIGDRPLQDKIVVSFQNAFTFGVTHDPNGYEINVERLTRAEMESLEKGMATSLRVLDDPRNMQGAPVERDFFRMRMFHRVRTCLPLVNAPVLKSWQTRLQTDRFPEFVCQTCLENLRNQEEDIIGELRDGHFESALWMARTGYIPRLIGAMLAAIGETNQNVKWQYRLLDQRRAQVGEEVVDAVFAFIRGPGPTTPEELMAQLAALSEPVVENVFQRFRSVRRSVLAFSHVARYNTFRNPQRWTRTSATP